MTQTQPESQPEAEPETQTKTKTKKVPRYRVVNRLLSLYEEPRYLEIGVCKGLTFDRVKAPVKVAVDPVFQFE